MNAKNFRKQAWTSLSGKWGIAILATLLYELIIIGASSVLPIVVWVVAGPFLVGLAIVHSNIIRTKAVEISNLFEGFKSFSDAFLLYLLNSIFTSLWSLLFIIPGIVKSYAYRMSYYIMADNPGISQSEARKRSIEMMNGNKWRLFCLDLSFIGWYLLSILTCGILVFFVLPYAKTAEAAFYEEIRPKEVPQPEDTYNEDNSEYEF